MTPTGTLVEASMDQHSPGVAKSWKRLDGVDLLRGLAIFFVLMNHVNMRLIFNVGTYAPAWPKPLLGALVWNGQFGVQMFFAISGFLITGTSLRRWRTLDGVSVRDFYLMRFARIAPLLLALLAVLSVLHWLQWNNFVVNQRTGGLGRAILAALTFHVNVLEARRGYLPANWDILWSLSVEEMFYLFFPIVCWFLGRTKLIYVLLCVFVVFGPFARTVLSHGNEVWQEYSYLGGMDAIALGCLTALLVANVSFSRRALRWFATIGVVLAGFILGFAHFRFLFPLGATGLEETILAIGTCCIVAWAAQSQWRSPIALGWLRSLGQRSYEIYLTHMFVVFALLSFFLRIEKPSWFVPVYFLLTVAFAGALGALVARSYSEPMNRWLRNRFGDGPERLGSALETR